MYEKVLTIKKRDKIIAIKNSTLSISNKFFKITYIKCVCNEVLIVNTKKNCKTSVGRNKMKRRIKEILRKNKWSGCLSIYSKNIAFSSSFQLIKQNLLDLIKKI